MPNIKGTTKVLLQPGDTKVGITIKVKAASSEVANDGYIPYGTTISNVVTTIYDEDGTDVTSDIVYASPTISAGSGYDDIKIELKYPSTNGEGRYSLKHLLTLDDGGTRELDFSRIYCTDLK